MSNLFAWGLRKFYDTDVEGLEEELSNLQQQVAGLSFRNKSLQEKGLADFHKIQSLQSQSGKLKNQVANLTQTNNAQSKQIDDLQSLNKAYKTSLDTANRNIDALQKQVDDLLQEIEKIQQNPDDREQLLDQIEQLKEEKADFEEKYNTSCNENKVLSKELSNAKTTIENLGEQINALNVSITNKNEQIKELNSSIADKVNELEIKEKQIEELRNKLKRNNADLGGKEIDTGDNSQQPVSDGNKVEESYKGGTPCVKDVETGEEIMAKDFFQRPEADIFKTRSELVKAMLLNKPKYVCKYCGGMVKVSGVKLVKGTPLHFMHVSEDADCKYNITDPRETRQGSGSGVRHTDPRRLMLRAELEKLLFMTSGVSNVRVGKTVTALQHPLFGRKRPDLQVSYQGKDLVIELQLSSNYVANLTERDLFYRLERKHVIRIFSFDKSVNSLDLNSMTSKDVYFNSHLNVFIFDDEAQEKSEKEGELYLKCNWIKATEKGDVWEYQNENASDKLGGKLIKLSDLTFEDSTYKPYYYDAEKEYYAVHEGLKKQYEQQKKDEDSIIDDLEKNWKMPKQPEVTDVDSIKDAYNIDAIINSTKSYVKGKSLGKFGLVTMDGVLRVPFEYEDIKTHYVVFNENKHSGWTEAFVNGLIDIYDASFNLKDKGIVRIEDFVGNGNLKKYVKKQDGYLLWGMMDSHGNA